MAVEGATKPLYHGPPNPKNGRVFHLQNMVITFRNDGDLGGQYGRKNSEHVVNPVQLMLITTGFRMVGDQQWSLMPQSLVGSTPSRQRITGG